MFCLLELLGGCRASYLGLGELPPSSTERRTLLIAAHNRQNRSAAMRDETTNQMLILRKPIYDILLLNCEARCAVIVASVAKGARPFVTTTAT